MAKKSSSRWLVWFLGCSFFVGFIIFCSCSIGGFLAYRFYQQVAAPPLTFAEFQNLMPDFPIYPNAKFDEMMTNLPPNRMIRGKFVEEGFFELSAVFRTKDSMPKVLDWHRRELRRIGWRELRFTQEAPEWIKHLTKVTGFSAYFTRGSNMVFFQSIPSGFQIHCLLIGVQDWEMQRLQEQVKANPNDGEAWSKLAWGHLCLARWHKAKEAAQKALLHPPEKTQTKMLLALILVETREFKEALPLVEELVKKPLPLKDESLAWQIYAICLSEVGRLKEAEQVLNKALASRFGDLKTKAMLHLSRGSILWRQGRISEALADYETAYKQDPSLWRILAYAYIRQGKWGKAMEVVKAMAKTDKFAQHVLNRKGKAVWLGIYHAQSPFYMSGRWVKNSGIKGNWAVELIVSRYSQNWAVLENALVFAVNGKNFKNERAFKAMIDELCTKAKLGDKVIFSVWRNGKVEQVIAKFEPFFETAPIGALKGETKWMKF